MKIWLRLVLVIINMSNRMNLSAIFAIEYSKVSKVLLAMYQYRTKPSSLPFSFICFIIKRNAHILTTKQRIFYEPQKIANDHNSVPCTQQHAARTGHGSCPHSNSMDDHSAH